MGSEKGTAREKVVLAYSGGLDTSVAVKWINETYNMDVIAYTCDLGPGAGHRGDPPEGACAPARSTRSPRTRATSSSTTSSSPRWPPGALRGEIPAGDGAGPSADRAAHGPRCAGARGDGRGARLHGQGERPGPLRRDLPDPRPRAEDHRAGPRVEVDADPGARVRRQARHRGRGDQEVDLQHRPEPLGPFDRGGHPRRPVGRAAARDLPVDGRPPYRPPTSPRRSRSPSSAASPWRSTAASSTASS